MNAIKNKNMCLRPPLTYAKGRDAYMNLSANQVGQIIVKESWMPPAEIGNGSSARYTTITTGSAKIPTQKKTFSL